MYIFSKLFRIILLMNMGIVGILINVVFIVLYLLFLIYALRRYNFGTAPFGLHAEDFKTPFIVTSIVTAGFAILIDLEKFDFIIFMLMIFSEAALFIWCFVTVLKYADEVSVVGNVIFLFIVALAAGQALILVFYLYLLYRFVAFILIALFVYIFASELGSF